MTGVNVSYSAIAENAARLKALVGDFFCVLKSDAYGHGAKRCAEVLYEAGFRKLAVYSLEEALDIKSRVDASEILILGRTPVECINTVKKNGFTQTVFSEQYARELVPISKGLSVHIKIDTGMNRTGFKSEACEIRKVFSGFRGDISGAYTHFFAADDQNRAYTEAQLKAFKEKTEELEYLLGKRLKKHAAASAGALRFADARLDASRIGLALYGILPDNCEGIISLKPAMSLYGEITAVKKVKKGENVGYGCDRFLKKDGMIATVSLGYGMGLPRCIEKHFRPCVNGKRVSFASRICMDRCMLDVTEFFEGGENVRVGDKVEFFGNGISVSEFAKSEKTIPYETLCRVGKMSR